MTLSVSVVNSLVDDQMPIHGIIYSNSDTSHKCHGISNHRQLNYFFISMVRLTTKESSASVVFARGIHWSSVDSLHRETAMWKVRADSRFKSSQWETALLCNNVSHWVGASLESDLESVSMSYSIHDLQSWFGCSIGHDHFLGLMIFFNSLTPGRFEGNYRSVIFKLILRDW